MTDLWTFIPTQEGILLVEEGGHVRGATPIEAAYYERTLVDPELPPLRRAERAIVRALKDAGLGGQSQVTHPDRFEIATDDIIVRVTLND